MTSYFNNGLPLFPDVISIEEEILQLQETSAVAPFIQTQDHIATWDTSATGPSSNHNLLVNTPVVIDRVTGDMSAVNSTSYIPNPSDPVTGSVWLNSINNHIFHGAVDLEATGGDVTGPISSTIGEIAIYGDIVGDFITNSNVIIDSSKNVGNYNSITLDSNAADPVPGSIWLNSGNNHVMHGAVDLEMVDGDVFGPVSSANNEITTYNGVTGKLIKGSGVTVDGFKNAGNFLSINFDSTGVEPVVGSLWNNSGVLYHNGNNLEKQGDVVGPGVAVNNNLASFDLTTGKLIKDSGISSVNVGNVVGPASSLNTEVPIYSGTTGKIITNSGILIANVGDVKGPASSVNNNLASFDLTTGKLIKDSGILTSTVGDVKGPGVAVNNNLAAFDLTTGKLIKDSGVTTASVGDVKGPGASVNTDLAVFSGLTGKLIADSGILLSAVGDVKGPASAINNSVPVYDLTTGKLIKNSPMVIDPTGNVSAVNSLLLNSLAVNPVAGSMWLNSGNNHIMHGAVDLENTGDVTGPGVSVNNDIAVFDLTTGKVIKDSGVLVTNVVTGPVSSTNTEIAAYNGATGKIITNTGILTAAVGDVKGPASAVNNNLAAFDLTTGKLIKDSGISSVGVGNVVGPASAVNNDIAVFDLTTGKLIKDSGVLVSNVVTGPVSSTNNEVAIYNGTSGKIITTTGLVYTNIVTGPASAVSGNLASYNGVTGKIIQDSGILTANVGDVKGPGSSTNNNIAVFDLATGKLIKDSGVLVTNVVTGPASAVSGNLASYNGTSGKIIQDSGVLISNIVTGPASAVDNDFVLFNGTSGKIIQDSGLTKFSLISMGQIYFLNNSPTNIALTVNIPALINPATTFINLGNFTSGSNGVLTYSGSIARRIQINYSISASQPNLLAADNFLYQIYKNGVALVGSGLYQTIAANNTRREVSASSVIVSAAAGDSFDLRCTNISNSDNINIYALNISAITVA